MMKYSRERSQKDESRLQPVLPGNALDFNPLAQKVAAGQAAPNFNCLLSRYFAALCT
jgi:hypothetical protein